MDIDIDVSDIEREIDNYEKRVQQQMEKRAREAVEVAKQTGSYRDVTGRLRASNKYKTTGRGVELINTAPYAQDVEARGEVVLSTAILYLQSQLEEDFKR